MLFTAAVMGAEVGVEGAVEPTRTWSIRLRTGRACSVTDGDTIKCNRERIPPLGMDVPELPGHCQAGRDFLTGDGHA